MNYYKHHLGDYAKDTRHLSMLEHGAYRLLLDHYYATERPIPDSLSVRIANARNGAEKSAVVSVLNQFFILEDGSWKHSKVVSVIEESQLKSGKASDAAKARWEAEEAMRTHNERSANAMLATSHKPLATSQEEKEQKQSSAASVVSKKKDQTIQQWLDEVEGDAIPETDSVFEYATKAGIPHDFLALAWAEFVARHTESGKRYRDFRAVFRKVVRENWYKLWWDDPAGGYALTTAGKQAQRVAS